MYRVGSSETYVVITEIRRSEVGEIVYFGLFETHPHRVDSFTVVGLFCVVSTEATLGLNFLTI